jgi:hypothetical protein
MMIEEIEYFVRHAFHPPLYIYCLLAYKFNNNVDFFLCLWLARLINVSFHRKLIFAFHRFYTGSSRFQLTNILWCVNVKKTRINNICKIPFTRYIWCLHKKKKTKSIIYYILFFLSLVKFVTNNSIKEVC